MINVTKTYLPPLEDYISYLQGIWERNLLTNNGPLVRELEQKLKDYLGVKHLFFVSNGTIALQIAIKALDLHGEVITTPFSYVATISSIVWEGCQPVFVDIDPETLSIDPGLIEQKITPKTTAILATHVYGYPCNVKLIQEIADQYGLKVIYDAAHAFGVQYQGTSLLNYGDISTISFHATKLFHTVEGGAVVTNDDDIAQRIAYMRNFGHKGTEDFWGLGINGKNSEFHAAMGLCIMDRVPELILKRKTISELYDTSFKGFPLSKPKMLGNTLYNYGYYPVLFASEEKLNIVCSALNDHQIFPRRYFYPSLNTLPYLNYSQMNNSEQLSKKILCLPLYDSLQNVDVESISDLIIKSIGKN
jgi:dTDP-4-amino-4,6-dideoxygalactose transaminase